MARKRSPIHHLTWLVLLSSIFFLLDPSTADGSTNNYHVCRGFESKDTEFMVNNRLCPVTPELVDFVFYYKVWHGIIKESRSVYSSHSNGSTNQRAPRFGSSLATIVSLARWRLPVVCCCRCYHQQTPMKSFKTRFICCRCCRGVVAEVVSKSKSKCVVLGRTWKRHDCSNN